MFDLLNNQRDDFSSSVGRVAMVMSIADEGAGTSGLPLLLSIPLTCRGDCPPSRKQLVGDSKPTKDLDPLVSHSGFYPKKVIRD